jgi:exosortase E/protease (VPEID-CTERM system)
MIARLAALAGLLAVELLPMSVYGLATRRPVGPGLFWDIGLSKYIAGFLSCYFVFVCLGREGLVEQIDREVRQLPIKPSRLGWQFTAILAVACLSAILHGQWTKPFAAISSESLAILATLRLCMGVLALALAGWAFFPFRIQRKIVRRTLPLAALAALAMLLVRVLARWNAALWNRSAGLTLRLVVILLRGVSPVVISDPATRVVGTPHFSVQIASTCSGIEGAGLMLAFSLAYLVVFRRECRFPQAFALVPAGILVLFAANAGRIAALIVLGNLGASNLAIAGFHSEAGWLSFLAIALLFCAAARRLPVFRLTAIGASSPAAATESAAPVANPTMSFLLPLVAVTLCGVLSLAATGERQWMYFAAPPLVAAALWARRRDLAGSFQGSWRGLPVGVIVFVVWLALDRIGGAQPDAVPVFVHRPLTALGFAWLAFRTASFALTTPIAEELAFRGFLARRLIRREFETLPLEEVGLPPILFSSAVFAACHGRHWLGAFAAGLGYAWLARKTGSLGDAILAHAATNACLFGYVLATGRWHLL